MGMASVMTSTARGHVGSGHLDVWGLGGYGRHREQWEKDYYNYHSHNHSQFFLQYTKMVATAGSPRSALIYSVSSPLESKHLLQLEFSSPLYSVKNAVLIGFGWDANHIGSKFLRLQWQVLQKCSALKESSTAPIETGLSPNNESQVQNSDLVTEKQIPNAIPLRKRAGKKRVPESSLITHEQDKDRDYALNGSVKFIDKNENVEVVQLFEGMNISGAAYAKCMECASYTTDANLNSVISILSRIGLNKDEIGLVFSKLPSLLKRDAVQLMKVFHLLQGLGCREEPLCGVCIQYPALLERNSDQIHKVIVFLQSVGLTREEVLSVLHRRPQVLSYPEDRVKLSVNYLLEIGVPNEDLWRILKKVICLNHKEKLKPVVEFLQSAGLDQDKDIEMVLSRNAQILCCNIEKNLRPKFKFFYTVGLSKRQVARIAVLFPSMFGLSIEGSLRPKYNYLVNVMKRSIEEIVDFPQYFGCSLEKRIKPRYEQLARRGIHASLPSMLVRNDRDFDLRYLHGNNHELSDNRNEEC